MTYDLGVDLGTTFTAAAISRDDHVEMVSLEASHHATPSIVFFDGERLVVGQAAEARVAAEPNRGAREFKRRLGDPAPILLGARRTRPTS